jgi:hypothetical protein
MWEDKINATGSEFKFMIIPLGATSAQSIDQVNEIWEEIVVDLITGRIPHSDDIAGIRINDKSRGELLVRVEVWLKFPNWNQEQKGKDIQNYITKDVFERH